MSSEILGECGLCGGMRRFHAQDGVARCEHCGWTLAGQRQATEYDQRPYSECPECSELRLYAVVSGHLACRSCGWTGTEEDRKRDAGQDNSARECFLEDTRRGRKGGGSKSSGRSRKKAGKGERMERGFDDGVISQRTTLMGGPKVHVLRLPDVNLPSNVVREAIAERIIKEIEAGGN